jgi:hypothetical protein
LRGRCNEPADIDPCADLCGLDLVGQTCALHGVGTRDAPCDVGRREVIRIVGGHRLAGGHGIGHGLGHPDLCPARQEPRQGARKRALRA